MQKNSFVDFNKDLKAKFDTQTVDMNASTHRLNNFDEVLAQKVKQIKVQQEQIERDTSEIEEKTITIKNQTLQIEN